MRQDPSAVPHPRASCEQISYQPDQDQGQQSPARQPPDQGTPDQQAPDQQAPDQQASYRQAPPMYPAAERSGSSGYPYEDPAYGAYEATLARIRVAQRKARCMQVISALLGVCAAVIFLVAAAGHQLDAPIELLTPVLLLSSAANTRRYAKRLAMYRAAEADILARAR